MRNRLVCILSFFSVGVLVFSTCVAGEEPKKEMKIFEDSVIHLNYAPKIPHSFTIFGEEVDLTNYYLRERFDRELLSFSYWHSQVLLIIKRANKFFPIIEPILKENGVPDDFKYLALIESNLDQRALSPSKAAGIWQLLEATAIESGLVVNEDVDERYNVEKATVAACQYLKRTYELTNSWVLAAASYNSGRARVLRQMNVQKTNNYFDMLFGEETNRYVFRIMLAKYVMENPRDFGFYLKKEDLYYAVETYAVEVDSMVGDLTDFAKSYGINYQLLKDANPWLRTNKITNKEKKQYSIKIPKKDKLSFSLNDLKVHNSNWIINP